MFQVLPFTRSSLGNSIKSPLYVYLRQIFLKHWKKIPVTEHINEHDSGGWRHQWFEPGNIMSCWTRHAEASTHTQGTSPSVSTAGTSLVVPGLRLWVANAGCKGSIPGQGTNPICKAAHPKDLKKEYNYVELFLGAEISSQPTLVPQFRGQRLSGLSGHGKLCEALGLLSLMSQTAHRMPRASRAPCSWRERCSEDSSVYLKKSWVLFFFNDTLQTSIHGLGKWEEMYLVLLGGVFLGHIMQHAGS